MRKINLFAVLPLLLFVTGRIACAQELSPRAYWPAPAGTQVLLLAYAHSSGDSVTDPSLPVTGADSSLNKALAAYFHTTSLFGRTTNLVVELPYAWGTTKGEIDGELRQRHLSNMGDLAVTMSVNFLGAPSMTLAEFRELTANPRPIFGASLKLVAPTGDYEADRLINVGANRWAVKGELGYILPIEPDWHLELEAGAWLFTDNDDFLGQRQEQDPIYAAEMHLVRRFGKGHWASIEANFFRGGRTTVDGVKRDDRQRNVNIGAALMWPIGARQSLKFSLSTGVVTESGGDYKTVSLSYLRVLK